MGQHVRAVLGVYAVCHARHVLLLRPGHSSVLCVLAMQVERQALTNTHPYIILCSDPIASLLSEPDLACLAHHFNPQHIQLLRDAAAKSGRQAPQSTAEAQQAGGAVEASGPRFNLAGLLLSYALAQPGLHR